MLHGANPKAGTEKLISRRESAELSAFSRWVRSRRPIRESADEHDGGWEGWLERLDRRVEGAAR